MSHVSAYLAKIGRRGGIRSRRTLEPDVARRMVTSREARRVARRAVTATRPGAPADTSVGALAVQDALLRRTSAAEKLAQAARPSRMVDQLSVAGLRQRHPTDDDRMTAYRRAELRLGRELAAFACMAPGMTSPNELSDPVTIALDIGARLDQLRVEWLIGGSLASSVHGEPRATQRGRGCRPPRPPCEAAVGGAPW